MAVFLAAAGTAFRAENFGLDLAHASDAHFYTEIFTDIGNATQFYQSATDPVSHAYRSNITSTLGITLDHSTFDDTFDTPFYENSAVHPYTGITSDFTFYDYATGSAVLVGTLTGSVYDIAVRDSYLRVLTETQEIHHANTVESFTGLFMGDDRVKLGGLADYFCDPQGDLAMHLGGGDDLGIHMLGNADDRVTMWGDAGNDQLSVQGGHGALYGGAGRDAITSYDAAFYDIYGGAGGDQVYAHRGIIHDGAGSGDDDYAGNGSGLLLLDYGTAISGIVADLWNGVAHGLDIGHDTLAGIRQLRGGQGDDRLMGMPALMLSEFGVTLWGDTGNDTVTGTSQADALWGQVGNDRLNGYDGADLLYGGAGRDVLTGGAGLDRFVFNAVAESLVATPDRITDFSQTDDLIDLHRIDARDGGRNNAFTFIGGADFTTAGQLRAFQQGGDTVIEGNTAGVGGAEFRIVLTGVLLLEVGD
ncbi:MAG: calcium-binding protein, partial [Pseudorhodobacter sp.]|nr:calcium-binding protein [Pseudorhodobacter sp.]